MSSINEEILRIETAKSDIEDAIEECGVDVPDTELISTYASYIRQIPSTVLNEADGRYVLKAGDTMTGALTLYSTTGDSPHLIFLRGETNDGVFDWDLYVTQGYLKIRYNNSGTWKEILSLYPGDNTLEGSKILTAANYTSYVNSTNFPGINKTGTVTSVTVTGANGLSGTGTIDTAGTITLSNAGVRSTTISGNYLRVNTNGTSDNLTIPYATDASLLKNTSISDPNSAASGLYLKWYSQISQSSGYAGTNTGFPAGSNANGILWMGTHSGPYGGLLGVSSNNRLYYRFITNNKFPTTANGGSWNKIAWTSDIPTIPSISVSTSGSGNAVTSITASNHSITVTKGASYYDASTSRTANTVLAAPNGSAGAATFRKLVAADIPDIYAIYKASNTEGANALLPDSIKHLGYGYAAFGWKGAGPAISFGSGKYSFLLLSLCSNTTDPVPTIYVRHTYNGTAGDWYTLVTSSGTVGSDTTPVYISASGRATACTFTAGETDTLRPLMVTNTTGMYYTPSITASYTAGTIVSSVSSTNSVRHTCTNSNGSVSLYTSTNRGLYDSTNSAWIIYLTKAADHVYVPKWASKGSATQPVYFNSSGEPTACNSYPTSLPANGGNADTVDGYHATSFAKVKTYNDLLHSTNEFTFASAEYSGSIWFNYRTASGSADGSITAYIFGDGKGTLLASITSGHFSGTSTNVTGTVAIANGGTGATSASAARTNLGLGAAAVKGVDTTVTSGSTNLITSGGVNTALNSLSDTVDTKLAGYLPLTGGEITGNLSVTGNISTQGDITSAYGNITVSSGNIIVNHLGNGGSNIVYKNSRANSSGGGWADLIITIKASSNNVLGYLGIRGQESALNYIYLGHGNYDGNVLRIYSNKVTFGDDTILHSGNASVSGNTITINGNSTTWTNTTYSTMTAATASAAGKSGLVPAPAANKHTSFLRGDGTWAVPTNTTYSAGNGLSLTSTTFALSCTEATSNTDRPIVGTDTANKIFYTNNAKINWVSGKITCGGLSSSGSINITGTSTDTARLIFSRTGASTWNYINWPGNSSESCLLAFGYSNSSASSYFYMSSKGFYPTENNKRYLGLTDNRWSYIYGVIGNFSSNVTITGSLSAQEGKFYTNINGTYWTSDRRFKTNIHNPVKSGLLQDPTGYIRKFNWKDTGVASYGYIAQELLPIIPEAVDYDEKLNKYSVNYSVAHSAVIGLLVIKIKELEEEIKLLKAKIN